MTKAPEKRLRIAGSPSLWAPEVVRSEPFRARRRDCLRVMTRGFVAASAATLLGGCAGAMVRPLTPQVTLVDLQLLDSTMLEGRFRASLRVQNPNNVALQFRGVQFAIDVNGLALAQGATANAIDLPRLGETVVDVDFSVGALSLVRQVLAWRDRQESLDYVLRGTLFTSGNRGLNFRETGRLSLT
ncbi:MAG: LEA type 2 family protein [Thioalkalivibrionaceae bacterium]